MNTKSLILFVIILVLALGCVIFGNLDDSLAKRQHTTEGTFISESTFSKGQHEIAGESLRYFTFKLTNGEIVNIEEPPLPMVQENPYRLGDKAKIYYRKGYFTGRMIYDSFYFSNDTKK